MILGVSNPAYNHGVYLNQMNSNNNPSSRNNKHSCVRTVFRYNMSLKLIVRFPCNELTLLILSPASAFEDRRRWRKYPNHGR